MPKGYVLPHVEGSVLSRPVVSKVEPVEGLTQLARHSPHSGRDDGESSFLSKHVIDFWAVSEENQIFIGLARYLLNNGHETLSRHVCLEKAF